LLGAMIKFGQFFLAGAFLLCLAAAAAAQPISSTGERYVSGSSAASTGKRPVFRAPAPSDGSINPQVTNGRDAATADWPATLLADGSGGCTVTAVGPKALLTAAHCLKYGTVITIVVGNIERTASCDLSGHYRDYDRNKTPTTFEWNSASADYALCLINDDGPGLAPDRFETISNAPVLSVNDTVRLVGYGCNGTTLLAKDGGKLREGTARIKALPQEPNNYIELQADGSQNNASVCEGDSGGAAYWPAAKEGRRIIGINSRTGVLADGSTVSGRSFISSMDTITGIDFALTWAKSKKVQVCGVWGGTNRCRE